MSDEKKNLKVFGYGLAVILGLVSFKVWRTRGWGLVHVLLIAGSIWFILVTKVNYEALKPLYTRWMKVAHFIGAVITGIILSIIFYFMFGLVGVVLRILRKDILDRKVDPGARTYWVPKEQAAFVPEHYTRQF